MRVVYIAGPFRAASNWGVAENIRNAERFALEVSRLGAMPLCPHTCTGNFHGEGSDQFWLDGTLELMRRCDAGFWIPGWRRSSGSQGEWAEAGRLQLPRFESLVSLQEWLEC